MLQMIIRADDLGYSEAINYGIVKAISGGLVRSVGLMPNMPAAAHGMQLIGHMDLSIGQHTNLCLGKPCADPERIPSLLDEKGNFKSSRIYRQAYAQGKEVIELEEAVIEVEAQYHQFLKLTGRKPDYFEAHAVMSKNLFKALEIVAERYDLNYQNVDFQSGNGWFRERPIHICPMESMNQEYDAFESLKSAVTAACVEVPNIYICHPGYLDEDVLSTSSLTVNRTKETAMLCNPQVKQWLESHGVSLLSYRDIL